MKLHIVCLFSEDLNNDGYCDIWRYTVLKKLSYYQLIALPWDPTEEYFNEDGNLVVPILRFPDMELLLNYFIEQFKNRNSCCTLMSDINKANKGKIFMKTEKDLAGRNVVPYPTMNKMFECIQEFFHTGVVNSGLLDMGVKKMSKLCGL